VTRSEIAEEPGVTIHHGLEPNSAALIELFTSSHVFVLASLAEAFPNYLPRAEGARQQ